ncbi:MAG TPA: AMP-binding protein, partial [Pyrinomonadaceae bacterium]|nr:AMP-binding protein [Pyrinomonadaceae bacterium]
MSADSLFDRIYSPGRDSRVALLYESREISYQELHAATVRTAEALQALGITDGDRVAVLLNDSPEFIASFVAIVSLGAIAVPINLALGKEDQLFILRDCGACAAIIEAQAAETLFPISDGPQAGSLPDLKNLLVVRRHDESEPFSIPGMNSQVFDSAQRRPLANDFPIRGRENAEAFILCTSGSTGEPKGAVHRQTDIFYTNGTFCREVLRLREGDRLFSSSRLP